LNRRHRHGGLLQACEIVVPLSLIAQTDTESANIITYRSLYTARPIRSRDVAFDRNTKTRGLRPSDYYGENSPSRMNTRPLPVSDDFSRILGFILRCILTTKYFYGFLPGNSISG
jgi:hypothetical protein